MDNQSFNYQSQESFKTVSTLLGESWKIYRSKIDRLLGVLIPPFLLSLLVNFLDSVSENLYLSVLSFFLVVIYIILWLIVIPALIYILKEDVGIREAYQKAVKILISYIWISVLTGLIVFGGFWLLIIPAIIFAVWFILADYVLICEEKRGMDVLLRSKHLVTGRWRGVFWRFLAINFLFFILLSPLFLPLALEIISEGVFDLIMPFFTFLITPFYVIYGFLIYENLKRIKKDIVFKEPAQSEKAKYVLIGILGTIVGLLFMFILISSILL